MWFFFKSSQKIQTFKTITQNSDTKENMQKPQEI